jgi:hypothetical protein
VESDIRYFSRRAAAERAAAARALTAAARERRLSLAAGFEARIAALQV